MQVSTAEDDGVLLYNDDNEPIAVELHQGHVRVTYDPGNQPATAIYRYTRAHVSAHIHARHTLKHSMRVSRFFFSP